LSEANGVQVLAALEPRFVGRAGMVIAKTNGKTSRLRPGKEFLLGQPYFTGCNIRHFFRQKISLSDKLVGRIKCHQFRTIAG